MSINKISGWLLLTLLVLSVAGCKKSEVAPEGKAPLSLTIDWSNIKQGSVVPKDATIYLYPIVGDGYGDPIAYQVVPVTKTQITLPEGKYRVIAHNNNLDKIQLRNAAVCTEFEGYVIPVGTLSSRSSSIVPEVECLHLLIGASSKEINIVKDVPLDLTLVPKTVTNTYRFNLTIDSPREYVDASAVLSGVATRINIFTAKVLPVDISNINVPLTIQKDEFGYNKATGHIEVLGVDPENREPGSNNLDIELKPEQTTPGEELPPERIVVDLTDDLGKFDNTSLDVDIKVETDPAGKLVLAKDGITVKRWKEESSVDLGDVVPNKTIKK